MTTPTYIEAAAVFKSLAHDLAEGRARMADLKPKSKVLKKLLLLRVVFLRKSKVEQDKIVNNLLNTHEAKVRAAVRRFGPRNMMIPLTEANTTCEKQFLKIGYSHPEIRLMLEGVLKKIKCLERFVSRSRTTE